MGFTTLRIGQEVRQTAMGIPSFVDDVGDCTPSIARGSGAFNLFDWLKKMHINNIRVSCRATGNGFRVLG